MRYTYRKDADKVIVEARAEGGMVMRTWHVTLGPEAGTVTITGPAAVLIPKDVAAEAYKKLAYS
jgi:hypothetical protein